jgi:hypothetical protein
MPAIGTEKVDNYHEKDKNYWHCDKEGNRQCRKIVSINHKVAYTIQGLIRLSIYQPISIRRVGRIRWV